MIWSRFPFASVLLNASRRTHFVSRGRFSSSTSFFPRNSELSATTYASLLRRCAAAKSASDAHRIHLHMIISGFPYLSLGNKLVDAYLKSGAVDNARKLFDEMPQRHIVIWNAMITSCIRRKMYEEAIDLFNTMLLEGVMPDEFTFSSVFKVFAKMSMIKNSRAIHGLLIVYGVGYASVFVSSALVDMYAKLGKMKEAKAVYNRAVQKDVVLSTALIVGHTQNGEDDESVQIFKDMIGGGIRANEFTYASVLIACGNVGNIYTGISIHGSLLKDGYGINISCQTSLLNMYSNYGLIDDALQVFNEIPRPNIIAWTSMMGCLISNSKEEDALSMFKSMIQDSIKPNAFAFSTALRACSSLSLFEQGKMIHGCTIKVGLDKDVFVGAALVDINGKCGHAGIARSIFDNLKERDLALLNSMINCYAQNSLGREAVELFDSMISSGFKPNEATYKIVLNACSNSGLLEDGYRIFSLIDRPKNDHCSCMVNLLGRCGRFEEAEELISRLKEPDKVLWRDLLSACEIKGEKMEIATRAARRVLELDPGDGGTFILVKNLYTSLDQWDEVRRMKCPMKVKKDPAMSWVEVINKESTCI